MNRHAFHAINIVMQFSKILIHRSNNVFGRCFSLKAPFLKSVSAQWRQFFTAVQRGFYTGFSGLDISLSSTVLFTLSGKMKLCESAQ